MKKVLSTLLLNAILMLVFTIPVFAGGPPINQGTTGNKTLTASWTPINYTITYNLGGGLTPVVIHLHTTSKLQHSQLQTQHEVDISLQDGQALDSPELLIQL